MTYDVRPTSVEQRDTFTVQQLTSNCTQQYTPAGLQNVCFPDLELPGSAETATSNHQEAAHPR